MDEAKFTIALAQCMALASERPRVLRIMEYLSELDFDSAWTAEERSELQRRVLVGLAEAEDADQVL